MSYTGYFEHSQEPPVTSEEREMIPEVAEEAYEFLAGQDSQMMALGDFIAELREYDIRTVVIDEVVMYMTSNGWVQLWKLGGTGETWISVIDDSSDDDD